MIQNPKEEKHLHIKLLYVKGFIDDKRMTKILVDGGVAMNHMSYATYRKLGKTPHDPIKSNMILKDFGGNPS